MVKSWTRGGLVALVATIALTIAASVPASAAAVVVTEFRGCTTSLVPAVPLLNGPGGTYAFDSPACGAGALGCNAVGVATGPTAAGASTGCDIHANGTYTNIVCGTGTTGGGANGAHTDTSTITATENHPIVGPDFSGAVNVKFGITFVAGLGVIVGEVTGDTTGLGLVGRPVNGVVQISPRSPSASGDNCINGVQTFVATGVAAVR